PSQEITKFESALSSDNLKQFQSLESDVKEALGAAASCAEVPCNDLFEFYAKDGTISKKDLFELRDRALKGEDVTDLITMAHNMGHYIKYGFINKLDLQLECLPIDKRYDASCFARLEKE